MRHWQKLQAGTLYIYISLGALAKFTLHPSLAFSYIGSVTAWHLVNSVNKASHLSSEGGHRVQHQPSF